MIFPKGDEDMKIMAVDDEALPLTLLEKSIRKAVPDADVTTFSLPADAIAAAAQTSFDVVFTDIQMPGMTGLELARSLKKLNPTVNIIFVTAFNHFQGEALHMHASDYLEKPVSAGAVREAMDNLLFAPKKESGGVFARTFGNFDLFIDRTPVVFRRGKSKEFLAYLIDRHGAVVSRKEIASVLFEDGSFNRTQQQYLSHIAKFLAEDLQAAGAGDLLVCRGGTYSVNLHTFRCDAYDYQAGKPEAVNQFMGEYMQQYSWAEERMGQFY